MDPESLKPGATRNNSIAIGRLHVAEIADRVQLSQRTVKRALARARELASDRIAADETQQFEAS